MQYIHWRLILLFFIINRQVAYTQSRTVSAVEQEIEVYEQRIEEKERKISKNIATNRIAENKQLQEDIEAYEAKIYTLVQELKILQTEDRTEAAFMALQLKVNKLEEQVEQLKDSLKNCGNTVFPTGKKIQSLVVGGIELIEVDGGPFFMGCSNDQMPCTRYEQPRHEVELSTFYMGKYEVTQQQWTAVMGTIPSFRRNCADCPVENISRAEILEFIRRLNKKTNKRFRLPTEAEWEYAARGGSKSKGSRYAGSNDLQKVAWSMMNSGSRMGRDARTHSVGQLQANELGLYDMSGNIMELCSDWFGEDYYARSSRLNPQGPERGTVYVARGGAYYLTGAYCRIGFRHLYYQDSRHESIGFRLVMEK